jgi:hypothetical protein
MQALWPALKVIAPNVAGGSSPSARSFERLFIWETDPADATLDGCCANGGGGIADELNGI